MRSSSTMFTLASGSIQRHQKASSTTSLQSAQVQAALSPVGKRRGVEQELPSSSVTWPVVTA
jgi:hypothetical protein